MKVISIIGQKGGTGKTTLAENLAVAASKSETVALIDLDSQPTSARWGDRRKSQKENPAVVSAQYARLAQVLAAAEDAGATLAIIDTPPRTSEATLAATRASALVLAPVRPLVNDVETLPALHEILMLAGPRPSFVVINGAPSQGNRHLEAERAIEAQGWEICPVVLRQRAAYGDAPMAGLGVVEYDPSGKAALEVEQLWQFAAAQIGIPKPAKSKRTGTPVSRRTKKNAEETVNA